MPRGSLTVALVGTVSALALAASCAPNRQPPPDPSIMTETDWPTCITANMTERIDHCPALPGGGDAAPAACTPRPAEKAPPAAIVLAARPPEDVALASPLLAKASAELEAAVDGDGLTRAKRAYRRALAGTAAGSPERGWAHLGMMTLHHRLDAHDDALAEAVAARKIALAKRDAALLEVTRPNLIATYALAGTLDAVHETFLPLSGDGTSEDRLTLEMMRELTTELAALGRLDRASAVVAARRRMDPERACLHQAELVALASRMQSRQATASALSTLVDDVQALAPKSAHEQPCRAAAAELLVDLGNTWRAEAIGEGDDPELAPTGSMDEVTLDYATQAHAATLDLFEQADLDAFGVCADRRVLAHRHAHLLYVQKSWNACGPAYEAALKADPRGSRGERAALAAVTCRQRAWLEDTARLELSSDESRMEAVIQRTDDWRMMLRAFQRYMCVARDQRDEAAPVSQAAFARAEAFLEGGALWESVVAFRLLAFSPTHGPAARHAARRYAEVMDDLANGDDVCRNELQLDLERLEALHCTAGGSPDQACVAIRGVLDRIRRHIL